MALFIRKRADKSGDQPLDGQAWPLAHVELTTPDGRRAELDEAPAEHNFADTLVAAGMTEGWIEVVNPRAAVTSTARGSYSRNPVVTGDELVLHLDQGDLRYEVLEHPGRYEQAGEGEDAGTVDVEHHEYRCRLVKGKR